MNLDLVGKHALVCGASQGIGHAAAVELAQLGADVTVLSRSASDLARVVQHLPRVHATQAHAYIAVDMRDRAALAAVVTQSAATRAINIVINNSGGPPGGSAHSAQIEEYTAAFEQHLLASQVVLECVLPGMRESAYGRIINVISTSVKEPIRNLGVSNTIRGAVASWAKTLATELAPFGITVNNVLPGYTKTRRLEQVLQDRTQATGKSQDDITRAMLASVPLGRFAEPSEIANVIAFLASPAAGYVNGVNIPVDGGRTLSL